MKRLLPLAGTMLAPLVALAHEGHGHDGTHWHATDTWGFVVVGAAAALIWWMRKK
jgi:hypothetical protein